MTKRLNTPSSENLPTPVSTFIGREKEIIAVKQLVLKNRLVTLTGAGGSGKTRLALQIAHELLEKFNTRVRFIELASLRDPSLISQKIATTLDIRNQANRPLLDTLVLYFSTRPSLLILDNCEHLIAACAEIAESLLQKCAELKILTTSREVLGITGEVVWTVPPLSLPKVQPWKSPTSAQEALEEYQKSESVQLYITRATTNSPEFKLTTNNAAWVAEICRRLDGMPLAIEMAAARARTLSVQQIAERLDDRFQLLHSGSRTAPPRQQTLESALDWSYELLSAKEKNVLHRLSVFAGGATLEAVEFVCAGEDIESTEIYGILSNLVDKSLVNVDKPEPGETRYRLLETIREFSLKKLADSQDNENTQKCHFEFYLHFAEKAEPNLRAPKDPVWFERIEEEHDNLRIALNWALESQNVDRGLRLAGNLGFFWFAHGFVREGSSWIEKLLEQGQNLPAASKADALKHLCAMLIWSDENDYDKITLLLDESLKLYRELDNKAGIAWILNYFGVVAIEQEQYQKAEQFLNESLVIRRKLGDPWSIAHTLQNFISLSVCKNDHVSARKYAEETRAWFQQAGDQPGAARILTGLGEIARFEGDFEKAFDLQKQALSQLLVFKDKWSIEHVIENLAALAKEKGNPEQAARLLGAAEALRESLGMPLGQFDSTINEQNVAAVRSSLGELAFVQTWAEGRSLSLEQIIQLALHDSGTLSSSQPIKDKYGGLTPREREAAVFIAQGKSNREIAEAMTVGVKTVETYVTRILKKLGFNSRVQIATWALDNELD